MRVAVADDAVLLRAGIVRLLEDAGFEVVAACGDATSLMKELEVTSPDVAPSKVSMRRAAFARLRSARSPWVKRRNSADASASSG